ncbi:MAG: ATP-binding protein [Saprospiraceae bacterium]
MAKDESPSIILADEQAMTSVITNLVENAIKYSKDNPQIAIRVYSDAKKVHLEIADNGIGIPSGEKGRVFEKFYRIGNEDTRTTKGTGLGLFIVKEIVKYHTGQIDVRDNKPQGTVFQITLPHHSS